jgi:hypothetical protein
VNALELEELEQYLEETDLFVSDEFDCLLQEERYPKIALMDDQVVRDDNEFTFMASECAFSHFFDEFDELRQLLYDSNDHDKFIEYLYPELVKVLPYTRFDAISRDHVFSIEPSRVERDDLELDISLFDFDRREVISLEVKEDAGHDYKAYRQAQHNSEFFHKLSPLRCLTDSVYLDANLFLPKSINAETDDEEKFDFTNLFSLRNRDVQKSDEELILEELSKYSKKSKLNTRKLNMMPLQSSEDNTCENNYDPTMADIYRPSDVAIFPKTEKEEDLAKELYQDLKDDFKVTYKRPTRNKIRRSKRADESAIPVSIMVDHESERPYKIRFFDDIGSYEAHSLNSKEIRDHINEIQGEYFG